MPISSIFFTPRRTKKNGISTRNSTSDIWPSVIFVAAFCMPDSLRKALAKL